MKDNLNFKGHFKIQAIDKDNNIVDEWSEDNMIMEEARTTMSEIFANLSNNTFIDYLKLGTLGHIGENIIAPKGANEGFVKERTRMFSESIDVANSTTINILRQNDVVKYTQTDDYYLYSGVDVQSYQILDGSEFNDTDVWTNLGDVGPYVYSLNFEIPGSTSPGGDAATIVDEFDSYGNDLLGSGSEVSVEQSDTSVTFTFDISTASANNQTGASSIFTEASLWANDRIFAMKTFKAKVKDSTVLLRIVWSITF